MAPKSESTRFHPFEMILADHWPTDKWIDLPVLVAVSGGADSVALLRALSALQPNRDRLSASHVNHRLRAAESDEDERFVRRLCADLDVSLDIHHADPHEIRHARKGDGLESACRRLRYEHLIRRAELVGARYIVTAHTANDQSETILHHIIRGTGFAGLTGISPVRIVNQAVSIIRPMIKIDRDNVLGYLRDLGQAYRVDSSNAELSFTRNRIRHVLIPQLEKQFNSQVRRHLIQLGQLAQDVQQEIESRLVVLDHTVDVISDGEVLIRTSGFAGVSRFLAVEFLIRLWRSRRWKLQSMDYERWRKLADMLCADSANALYRPIMMPEGIRVTREPSMLRIERTRLRSGQP
jgi:tRNA(Ile)-lysidine synthase